MNFAVRKLRLAGLCIGIVITMMAAWWLAGRHGGRLDLRQSTRPNESQPKVNELQLTSEGVSSGAFSKQDEARIDWKTVPVIPIQRNPFQEQLIHRSTLLEQRRIAASESAPARELRLWRTSFKYPLVREETWLGKNANGEEVVLRREFSVADHAMIKFPDTLTSTQVSAWVQKRGLHLRHALRATPVWLVAHHEANLDTVGHIMAAFEQDFSDAGSAVAERDFLIFPSLMPNDASFSSLWGMNNTGQTGGVVDADIDATEAWDLATGSRQVLVGVIDTGIDRTHPDLAANLWTNPREVPNNRIDDDGNGFVDDVNGWDFFSNDNDPSDENNHGTHCAGTIGGVGNNQNGVVGVCWQVSMVAIRFLGPDGGTTSDAVDSVHYARLLGVHLTSNSWGGGGYSSLLLTAIQQAGTAGQLFVAAAGNDGLNSDLMPNYPSSYAAGNIIAVAASTDRDARASFSNYGATTVDLAAPGDDIYSTIRGGGYASFNGTSMATPHVAGAAALLLSVDPSLSVAELKSRIMTTVDVLPSFVNTTVSRGRLNVARLIQEAAGPRPLVQIIQISERNGLGNGDGVLNPGETLDLFFQVTNRGAEQAENVSIVIRPLVANSAFTVLRGELPVGTISSGASFVSPTPFQVRSAANTVTPLAEEIEIIVRYGMPTQTLSQRYTLYLLTSSYVQGRVTDAATGAPLAGATVRLTGPSTLTVTTDAEGRYRSLVTNGNYQAVAHATGFLSSLPMAVTVPPDQSDVNFILGVPKLLVTPNRLDEILYSGRKSTRRVELRNQGSAALEWTLRFTRQPPDEGETSWSSLPARQIYSDKPSLDTGLRSFYKSSRTQTLAALNAPLVSLAGVTVGMLASSWDRAVLSADLQARGARILTITAPLTPTELSELNVLIVDDAIGELTANDLTQIRARVMGGMGLLCEADDSASMTSINRLFQGTGITAISDGFRDVTFTDIRTHPMTLGVSLLVQVSAGAYAMVSEQSQTLVAAGLNRAHAAFARFGSGLMLYTGNEITDEANFITGDGRRFANQIIDGLAAGPSWVKANPQMGTLQPGAIQVVEVDFDSSSLSAGVHETYGVVLTNTPDAENQTLPVTLNVVDAAEIRVSATSIDFGSVVEGMPVTRDLTITNIGQMPLEVNRVELVGADAAHFQVQPLSGFTLPRLASRGLSISLSPSSPKRQTRAELRVFTNDPIQGMVTVNLLAQRQVAPDVHLSPKKVDLTLREGQQAVTLLTMQNRGKGPLHWRASLITNEGRTPRWAQLSEVLGVDAPGSMSQIRIWIDTFQAGVGENACTFILNSNDPDTPEWRVPINLHVQAVPLPKNEAFHDAGETWLGRSRRFEVDVQNTGSAPLVLGPAVVLSSSFRCLTPMPMIVAPKHNQKLAFEFSPRANPGRHQALAAFLTNSPSGPLRLHLMGTARIGPRLAISPGTVSMSLPPGVEQVRWIRVMNTGDQPLNWRIDSARLPDWLKVETEPITLQPGQFILVALRLNTNLLEPGLKNATLVLQNENTSSETRLPLSISIRRSGSLVIAPRSISLDKSWVGHAEQSSFRCENKGNHPLTILSLRPSHARLKLMDKAPQWPMVLLPGEGVDVPFSFTAEKVGQYADAFFISSNIAPSRPVRLPVSCVATLPPLLKLSPSGFDVVVEPSSESQSELVIENAGGGALTWKASISHGTGPAADLSALLSRVQAAPVTLTGLLWNGQTFIGGTSGNFIEDGGDNRYDDGNILSTDVLPERRVDYSDGIVINSPAFGASSRYFTLKTGPLWMLAADLDGISKFVISGGLGADGDGRVSGGQITRTVAGMTYRGFYKRVNGASVPSVNHLIIVQDRDGLVQRYDSNNTDSDFHEISGLTHSARLYYLMFGLRSGVSYSESSFGVLMETFLREMVHRESADWLRLEEVTGQSSKGQVSRPKLSLSPAQLLPGIYNAAVQLETNSPATSVAVVPVTMRVPSRIGLLATPGRFDFPETYLGSDSHLVCTLSNPGNQTLEISDLYSSSSAYIISGFQVPRSIPRGGKVSFSLIFRPDQVAAFPAELVIRSNAHQTPEVRLPLDGRCLRGPALVLAPAEIITTMEPGSTSIIPLNLSNHGDSLLGWSAQPSASLVGQVALSPATGTVFSGASQSLSLSIMTSATTVSGFKTGSIRFTSNDMARRVYDLPVSFTVTSRPRASLSRTDLAFGKVMLGAEASGSVQIRNTGNAMLRMTASTSNSSAFILDGVSFPRDIPVNGSLTLPFRFLPTELTHYSGEVRFALASPALPSELLLRVSGEAVLPPLLVVQPNAEINVSLKKGQSQVSSLSLRNDGGSLLMWQAQIKDRSTPAGTLTEVLQRMDVAAEEIKELIPDIFLFQDGVTGTAIYDGGEDMYDYGNYLNTNLGSYIPYSDGNVTSGAQLGVGGSYFTRKKEGLFLFAADFAQQVNAFSISGNLGADGAGEVDAAVMDRSHAGRDYVGYFKCVHGAYGDPSVNHLIIMERRPTLSRTYSTNSDLDDHAISGFSGGRVYYLLFSRKSGLPVSEALAGQIMDLFLDRVALTAAESWIAVSPTSGALLSSASSQVMLTFQTQDLPVGLHTAKVVFSGNAPGSTPLEIPIKLTVLETDLSVSPQRLEWNQMHEAVSSPSRLTITARAGQNPSWTATSNVSWLTLSQTRGTGSGEIDLTAASSLPPGTYNATVSVTSDGATLRVPVALTIHATSYSQLFTDYRQPSRILGLVRGKSGQSSLLVSINSSTLVVTRPLLLPTDITDADMTTDGSKLYAISFTGRSITEVDLDRFIVTRSQSLVPTLDAGSTDPYHYDVEAGRPGIVYYTDAAAQPELHVFDFENSYDLSTFKLNSGAGIADLNVSPDGNFIHAVSQSSWSGAGTASVVRINSSGNSLLQTHLASQGVPASPLRAGVFFNASRDAFHTRNYRYSPLLESRQDYSRSSSIIATSAYGHALVFGDALVESLGGTTLATLPPDIEAAAFTASQDALIYQHPIQQRPIRVALSGILELPSVSLRPGIPDAGSVTLGLSALTWSGLPTAASYDVYLGDEEETVRAAATSAVGVYRLNTTGVSYTLPQGALQLGATYYWRIDARAPDGTVQRGQVWSFTVAPMHATLVTPVTACFPGGTVQGTLSITTAASSTPWTLAETSPWLSMGRSSGSGPSQVTLTYTPGSLVQGAYTTQITIRSGTHRLDVPVTLRVLGPLNLVKLLPDPALPVIYGLHTEALSAESFMLWINPATAAIQHVVPLGWEVRDFIVQAHDDRLYLLKSNGLSVAALQRQQDRALSTQWTTGVTATQIFNGPAGRIVLLTAMGSLRLHHSVLGGQVGSARSVPVGSGVAGSFDGRFLLTSSPQGLSSTILSRFDLTSTSINTALSVTALTAFSNAIIVSGDGNRAFYAGVSYDATSLASLGNRITSATLIGSSWTGHVVWSATQALASSNAALLSTFPVESQVITSTPDHTHLLRYQSSTNSLISQPAPEPPR